LGLNALPLGYVQIPIYTYIERNINDDLDFYGCSYCEQVDNYNYFNPEVYNSVDYLIDDLDTPVS
jgi:hypothetical protein